MLRESNLTYRDIMVKFKQQNPYIEAEVVDYRPLQAYTIRIELRHGIMLNTFYDVVTDRFSILKIERRR